MKKTSGINIGFWLIFTLAVFIVLWMLVLLSANNCAQLLLHFNLDVGINYYLNHFQVLPLPFHNASPVQPLYLWASAISARLFGLSQRTMMLPDLMWLLVLYAGVFLIGRELRDNLTGLVSVIGTATLPAVLAASQAYESSIADTAALSFIVLFVLRWLKRRNRRELFGALLSTVIAMRVGLGLTTETMLLGQICAAAAAFALWYAVRREDLPAGKLKSFLIPVLIAVTGGLTLYLTSHAGRDFSGYHVNEWNRTGITKPDFAEAMFYPYAFFLQFVDAPALLLILAGFLFDKEDRWDYAPLILWIVFVILPISLIEKKNPVYILPSAAALGLSVGLAGSALLRRKGLLGALGAAGCVVLAASAYQHSFKGSREYVDFTSHDAHAYFNFVVKPAWSEETENMDRQAKCFHEVADRIKGPNGFVRAMMIGPVETYWVELYSRFLYARPRTLLANPLTEDMYLRFDPKTDWDLFDFVSVQVEKETAGTESFAVFLDYWAARSKPNIFREGRLQALHEGSYEMFDRGCGLAFFRRR